MRNVRFEMDDIRDLLLELAQQHTIEQTVATFARAAERRTEMAALAIWTLGVAKDGSPVLELLHFAGRAKTTAREWRHADGTYGLVPLHEPLIGSVAASRREREAVDATSWERPAWAVREGIVSYTAVPLVARGELLGVLAGFSLVPFDAEVIPGTGWRRVFADHVAAAIATARDFEEIQRLRTCLERENAYLRREVQDVGAFGAIVGQSEGLHRVLEQIRLVGPSSASVLIGGESGTGKELVARAIHESSPRAARPLIRVNCASIPAELFESEFFGHVRGAFTGAASDKVGRFELADGGTLFLDEVAEMPLPAQAKLLRVLEDGTFERVGDPKTRTVDVRVIAASNRNLSVLIEQHRFREDLYFRLGVFPIEVPPLRQRRSDIEPLALHFLKEAAARLGWPPRQPTARELARLLAYDWPGNVRELRNACERAAIVARTGRLSFDFLPAGRPEPQPAQRPGKASPHAEAARTRPLSETELRAMARDNLALALERCSWQVEGPDGAAALLGLRPSTLRSRMARLGVRRPT